MNILLIGGETSLGKAFLKEAEERQHNVSLIPMERLTTGADIALATRYTLRGRIGFDWIVNCHGRNQLHRIGETPRLHSVSNMLFDNVMPIYWVIDELVRLGTPGSRVLSIASQTYRIPQTNTAIYCASKAALVMLMKVMARELADRGWILNCLAPGKIEDTRMAELTDAQVRELRGWTEEEATAYALRNVPARRFTNTDEVVEAMFSIYHLPAYVNGSVIDMTGGA